MTVRFAAVFLAYVNNDVAAAVGAPAVIKEGRANSAHISLAVENYVERSIEYRRDLRRIG